MATRTLWRSFYQVLPDGRFWIPASRLAELGLRKAERLLETTLKDKPGKAVLLDKPFQLAGRLLGPGIAGFYLVRIRLRDLQGWPPRISRGERQPRFPNALACALKSVRLLSEPLSLAIEFELVCMGRTFKAWQVGCPPPLVRSACATLKQDGTIGQKLADLQEMRLIGAE